MKLLLLSDTQTDRGNLEEMEVVLTRLLQAAKVIQPQAIIHAGDVKEDYDRVPMAVIKFWVRATKLIQAAGFRFIFLKGNHDRISQSADSTDWLDILRAAGAETISSKPAMKTIGNGLVHFLPFTPDKKQEIAWAKEIAAYTNAKTTLRVLIFHTEIQDAIMNSSGMLGSGISLEDLYADKYDACIGGHFHQYQKVGDNCWYVGSPFCHSWNEANTTSKGFLFANIEKGAVKIKRLPVGISGWYDAEWLESSGHVPEEGAYIRSKIPVTSKKITDQLRAEEARLKSKYSNVRLFVVPQLVQSAEQEIQLTGTTDQEKVEQYVSFTFSEQARFKAKAAVAFLSSKLSMMGQSPSFRQIRVLGATGSNVLCFPKIEVLYDKQNLVLIRGRNNDWGGKEKSNGSGKSSLLGLVPIALFGRTLKDQTHDSWAGEYTEKPARVTLQFENEKKELIEIERTRRPHGLFLRINGTESSTGLKGTGKNETQGEIEKLLGYDFQTFINAVYIDNSIANSFLFGTQKGRMDLISKFLNLERFDVALKLVGKEIEKCDKGSKESIALVEHLEEERDELEGQLNEVTAQVDKSWQSKHSHAQEEVGRLQKELSAITAVEQTYAELQESADALKAEETRLCIKEAEINGQTAQLKKEKAKMAQLIIDGKCSYCGQPSIGPAKQALLQLTPLLNEAESAVKHLVEQRGETSNKLIQIQKKIQFYQQKKNDLTVQLNQARKLQMQAKEGAEQEAERNAKLQDKNQKLQLRLKQLQRRLKSAQAIVKQLSIDMELLEYSKKAFNRSGMPLLLCQQLCPLLNQASDYYAELFFEGRQKVRFSVADQEFQVEVFNTTGSNEVEGQSTGEAAMAGLICAMALREAAPKTNLLILDEPGAGLDSEGARSFAKGLLQLKKNFETILVTTHHPAISGTLEDVKIWTVEKTDGLSKLLCP